MNLAEPPVVVSQGRATHGVGRLVDEFQLPDLWSLHLYDYSAELEVDGLAYPITPGSVSLVPPASLIRYRYQGPSTHLYAHLRTGPARGRRRGGLAAAPGHVSRTRAGGDHRPDGVGGRLGGQPARTDPGRRLAGAAAADGARPEPRAGVAPPQSGAAAPDPRAGPHRAAPVRAADRAGDRRRRGGLAQPPDPAVHRRSRARPWSATSADDASSTPASCWCTARCRSPPSPPRSASPTSRRSTRPAVR